MGQVRESVSAGSDLEQLVRRNAAERPEDVWLLWQDETYRWREVLSAARRVANGLAERGLAPGERVAILLPNRPEFLWVHLGILFAGGLCVPVNISQRGAVLAHILRDCDAVLAVFDDDLRDVVVGVKHQCPQLRTLVVLGDRGPNVPHTVEDLLGSADEDLVLPAGAAPGGVGIMYTSGTTGPPKGVVSTSYDFSGLQLLLDAAGVRPGETMYTPLPLYHGNALVVSAIGSMLAGARLALGRRFSASQFWDECRRFDAVQFNALGGMIPILLKAPNLPDDLDNPVRVVLSAGAPPDHRWTDFEQRFGLRLVEWFGMVDSPGNLLNDVGLVGSMGKPVPGIEAKVVDDSDHPLPANQVGELVFRHHLGQLTSYHKNPEATEEAYRGGWFHSGDLVECDAEGFFYYRGRKKQSMRRRGENISSWEVETVVEASPMIKECAAFGVPADMGEEEVMVAVVPVSGSRLTAEDVIDACRGRLAYYAIPRFIDLVDELPKTDTQRVQYGVLTARGRTKTTWDRDAAGVIVQRSGQHA